MSEAASFYFDTNARYALRAHNCFDGSTEGRATIYDIVYGKTWKHVPFPHGSSVRNADAPYPLASSDTAPVTVPPVTGAFSSNTGAYSSPGAPVGTPMADGVCSPVAIGVSA